MGALRAVEAEPYGMRGVGTVFRWYRNGRLHRDDDVAVLYYSLGNEYVLVSVPMVQVLWTVQRARQSAVWSDSQCRGIIRTARSVHWTDRSWSVIGQLMNWSSLASDPIVQDPRSNIKAIDALKVIQEVWKTPWTSQHENTSEM